jgi:hypothetical protein
MIQGPVPLLCFVLMVILATLFFCNYTKNNDKLVKLPVMMTKESLVNIKKSTDECVEKHKVEEKLQRNMYKSHHNLK